MQNDGSVAATREHLLKLLAKKEGLLKEYEENYVGPGLSKKLKRLLKYRGKYLRYCFAKLKPHSIKTQTFWGADFLTFLPEDFTCRSFGLLGGPEIKLIKFLIKNLDDNSVFYDIGANAGYYSLLAKEISDSIEVHSFEPVPKTFEHLKKNLSGAQNIFLNQLAVFNQEKQVNFYDMTGAGYSGSSTFDAAREEILASSRRIEVKTTTMDGYCNSHLKPNFLKIDVEGAESQVIEGGIKTLKAENPIIAMEVWKKDFGNASHLKAMEILYGLGYKSYKISDEGELEYIEKIDPERDTFNSNASDNFIFQK